MQNPDTRPDPYTREWPTTSAGRDQGVRFHLARADGEVHAVLQYRHGDDEWWMEHL